MDVEWFYIYCYVRACVQWFWYFMNYEHIYGFCRFCLNLIWYKIRRCHFFLRYPVLSFFSISNTPNDAFNFVLYFLFMIFLPFSDVKAKGVVWFRRARQITITALWRNPTFNLLRRKWEQWWCCNSTTFR